MAPVLSVLSGTSRVVMNASVFPDPRTISYDQILSYVFVELALTILLLIENMLFPFLTNSAM